MAFHFHSRAVVVGLCKRVEIAIASIVNQREPFLMTGSILVLENGNQFLVIFSQKANINVIVPRNIALVAHRTEQGSVSKAILQIVFFANALDFIQDTHLDFTKFILFNLFHRP